MDNHTDTRIKQLEKNLSDRIGALEAMSQKYYNKQTEHDRLFTQVQELLGRLHIIERQVQGLIAKVGVKI